VVLEDGLDAVEVPASGGAGWGEEVVAAGVLGRRVLEHQLPVLAKGPVLCVLLGLLVLCLVLVVVLTVIVAGVEVQRIQALALCPSLPVAGALVPVGAAAELVGRRVELAGPRVQQRGVLRTERVPYRPETAVVAGLVGKAALADRVEAVLGVVSWSVRGRAQGGQISIGLASCLSRREAPAE
jgi:hypothetical protein